MSAFAPSAVFSPATMNIPEVGQDHQIADSCLPKFDAVKLIEIFPGKDRAESFPRRMVQRAQGLTQQLLIEAVVGRLHATREEFLGCLPCGHEHIAVRSGAR